MRHAAWNSGLCRPASPNNSDPFVDTLSVLFVAFVPYDLYVPDPFVASLYLFAKYPYEL